MKPTKCSFHSSFNIWFHLCVLFLDSRPFFLDTHKIVTFYSIGLGEILLEHFFAYLACEKRRQFLRFTGRWRKRKKPKSFGKFVTLQIFNSEPPHKNRLMPNFAMQKRVERQQFRHISYSLRDINSLCERKQMSLQCSNC